jgi:hypothetical protein
VLFQDRISLREIIRLVEYGSITSQTSHLRIIDFADTLQHRKSFRFKRPGFCDNPPSSNPGKGGFPSSTVGLSIVQGGLHLIVKPSRSPTRHYRHFELSGVSVVAKLAVECICLVGRWRDKVGEIQHQMDTQTGLTLSIYPFRFAILETRKAEIKVMWPSSWFYHYVSYSLIAAHYTAPLATPSVCISRSTENAAAASWLFPQFTCLALSGASLQKFPSTYISL